MYVANLGTQQGSVEVVGLRILDVSAIQDRRRNPTVRVVSDLTWGTISLPQVAEPFTRDGRPYLLEVDEYSDFSGDQSVGAARIIDIADPGRPKVVSDLRLFDISDLEHPREIGYFNRPILLGSKTVNPTALGAFAMSQPAWDVKRRQVWYSDGNSGFYVVGLRGGIGRLLRR